MTTTNDIIESLVERIKSNTIKWTSLDRLKCYLRNNQKSLADIALFQLYIEHLRKDKFIFDCKESYFSLTDSHLYIVSKKLHDLEYRLDKFNFNNKKEWINTNNSTSGLLRLKNIIVITNSDSDEECEIVLKNIEKIST